MGQGFGAGGSGGAPRRAAPVLGALQRAAPGAARRTAAPPVLPSGGRSWVRFPARAAGKAEARGCVSAADALSVCSVTAPEDEPRGGRGEGGCLPRDRRSFSAEAERWGWDGVWGIFLPPPPPLFSLLHRPVLSPTPLRPSCLLPRQLQKPQADSQRGEAVQVQYLQQGFPPGVQPDLPHAHPQRQEALYVRHLRERILQKL